MKNIVLDTSFIVDCAINNIDIERELRRILPFNFTLGLLDRTMEELATIISRGPNKKEGRAAKLAQTIILTKKFIIYPTPGRQHTDKLLAENADENHIIATQDAGLKKELKKRGQPHIHIRQQKKLALSGYVNGL